MDGGLEKKKRVLTKEEIADAQDGLLRWHIEEQEKQLTTDYLTGLKNRAVFWKELEQSLKAVRENELAELCLIAIDIDHFKDVNDSFGHPAGDEVLRRIGALFKESIPPPNVAARVGGEELMILMPNAEVETARRAAEKLRTKISSIEFSEYPNLKVTASFGIASSKNTTDPQGLYDLADRVMYTAKDGGRDRIETYFDI